MLVNMASCLQFHSLDVAQRTRGRATSSKQLATCTKHAGKAATAVVQPVCAEQA